MTRIAALLITTVFSVLSVTAYAQQPAAKKAPASTSSDPIVQMREAEAEVRRNHNAKVSALRKERSAKMQPMIDEAVKRDVAKGMDPLVAQREARSKARAATRAEFDPKIKAATAERDAAIAEIRRKAGR